MQQDDQIEVICINLIDSSELSYDQIQAYNGFRYKFNNAIKLAFKAIVLIVSLTGTTIDVFFYHHSNLVQKLVYAVRFLFKNKCILVLKL